MICDGNLCLLTPTPSFLSTIYDYPYNPPNHYNLYVPESASSHFPHLPSPDNIPGSNAVPTVQHMHDDCLGVGVGRAARVLAGVRRHRPLNQEVGRGDVTLLRDHTHSTSWWVVVYFLSKKKNNNQAPLFPKGDTSLGWKFSLENTNNWNIHANTKWKPINQLSESIESLCGFWVTHPNT